MAKDTTLDDGFEPVELDPTPTPTGKSVSSAPATAHELDDGFEPVPHEEAPGMLSELGDYVKEKVGNGLMGAADTAAHVAKGMTFGASDKIAGGLATIPSALSGKKNLQELYDEYKQHQADANNFLAEGDERSPVLSKVGDFAGAMASPVNKLFKPIQALRPQNVNTIGKVLGNMGVSALEGSATGATAGALSSQGADDVVDNTLSGAGVGGFVGGGMGALGGAAKYAVNPETVANSPMLSSIKGFYDQAKKTGTSLFDKGTQKAVMSQADKVAEDATNAMTAPLDKTQKLYGQLIDAARTPYTPDDYISKQAQRLIDLNKKAGFVRDADTLSLLQRVVDKKNVNARELKTLTNQLGGIASNQNSIGSGDAAMFNKTANEAIEGLLPPDQYKMLNAMYSGVREGVEPTLNKGILPKDFQTSKVSDYSPEELKSKILKEMRNNVIPGVENHNISGLETENAFDKMMQGLRNADDKTASNTLRSQVPSTNVDGIDSSIRDIGKRYSLLQKAVGLRPEEGGNHIKSPWSWITSPVYRGAEKAADISNSVSQNSLYQTGRNLMRATDSTLHGVADKVSSIPGGKVLGQSLKDALDNKSQAAKTAALFSIAQSTPSLMKPKDNKEDDQVDRNAP